MDKIKNYIKRHNLINKEDKIVIGFSGGPDSLYLMLVLLELRQEFSLSLAAVYINHQLLVEASRHEAFARRFCEEHGVPFYCYRKDIASYAAKERLSIEEAGESFGMLHFIMFWRNCIMTASQWRIIEMTWQRQFFTVWQGGRDGKGWQASAQSRTGFFVRCYV